MEWGGDFKDDHWGISWMKWNNILNSFKIRGLGVGNLLAKNLGLLRKWIW